MESAKPKTNLLIAVSFQVNLHRLIWVVSWEEHIKLEASIGIRSPSWTNNHHLKILFMCLLANPILYSPLNLLLKQYKQTFITSKRSSLVLTKMLPFSESDNELFSEAISCAKRRVRLSMPADDDWPVSVREEAK
jgi:hypothetical protein